MIYPYENYLHVREITGEGVKAFLEQGARYYEQTPPGAPPKHDPSVRHYNFGQLEGVAYRLNVSKPVGARVEDLRYRGRPVVPTDRFRLAVNSYRAAGGGGFDMVRQTPLVKRIPKDIRSLLLEYVQRHGTIKVRPSGNWSIVTR